MSGRDEKPKSLTELTFQRCSNCSEFQFWIGRRNDIFSIYFNPIEYQKKHKRILPVMIYSSTDVMTGRLPLFEEFDSITHIECPECGVVLNEHEQDSMISKAVNYIVGQG